MAAAEGQVIGCHTEDSWKDQIDNAKRDGKLVVADFTASWCGPCRMIAPFFADLAKKYTGVVFLKVDVDELAKVAADWGVEAMPTFIFIKDGKFADKVVGAVKVALEEKTVAHMNSAASS